MEKDGKEIGKRNEMKRNLPSRRAKIKSRFRFLLFSDFFSLRLFLSSPSFVFAFLFFGDQRFNRD